MDSQTLLSGTIRAVVYQNEENGYAVLKLEDDTGQPVTAVGTVPLPAPGEELTLAGSWTTHASYGKQFKGELVERLLPTTAQGILDYLSGGAVPGIGAKTAEKLVRAFGSDTLLVLEQKPERLTAEAGLTLKRARELCNSYRSKVSARQLMEFLHANGFDNYLALRVYRLYGNDALEQIQQNPFLLTDEAIGADFRKTDELAIQLGIPQDDPRRIQAGLLYELEYHCSLGHVFLKRSKLVRATMQMLGLEQALVEKALEALAEEESIIIDHMGEIEGCYLRRLYEDETATALILQQLAGVPAVTLGHFDALLSEIQDELSIQFAPQQAQAIRLAGERHLLVLTGGPGTGKTTTVRGILALYDALGYTTLLAAPTGRAAKRMEQLCGQEASTIHRMLEVQFDESTGRMSFFHDAGCPLKAECVIVDEVSMLDISLMASLLRALPDHCRLVLVGDRDQLPSVGPGRVLSGILRSGVVPAVRLEQIYRQAEQSLIVVNAHAVNRGELPRLTVRDRDFFFLKRRSADEAAQTICDLCRRRLPENMGISPEQIQVLSPTRVGKTGTVNLNRQLQQALNPAGPDKPEVTFGDYIFRKGDRVMQVRNNYDLVWTKTDGTQGCGVFNGDVGTIEALNPADKVLTLQFDDRTVEYGFDMLQELEPAYAITVHKSQGSEYRAVVLAVCPGPQMLLTRSVLYTAITRARELLILVGDEQVVAAMTANAAQVKRSSALCYRLQSGDEGS